MQVQKENREITMSGFDSNVTQFSIEATPKAFQILSSSIYTDKPLAVIRELSCNAYDAHVEAGTLDKPFDVHLPNSFEPWFSIRDYGTGLSDKDITGLYSTYFKSTKTNSNDVIGCMGLGSKSPFAYVDQFTVTSFFNGEKTVFIVFMDDEGTPSIMQTEKEKSQEPNGIMIHMMVNQGDFGAFADRAKRFYHRFPTRPNITGNSSVSLTEVKYTLEGPNYKLRTNDDELLSYSDHKGAYAIQGNVAYPIKVDKIKLPMTDIQRELLSSMAIDIIFPIGEVEVAASREELSYNKITQANIIKAVEVIEAHVPKHATKVLSDAKNEFEARTLYSRWLDTYSIESRFMSKVLGKKLTWNKKEISSSKINIYMYDRVQVEAKKTVASGSLDSDVVNTLINLHHIDEYGDIAHMNKYDLRKGSKVIKASYKKSIEISAGIINTDAVIVLVDDVSLFKGIARLIEHNYSGKDKDVYALRVKPGFEKQVKDQFLGFDNFVLASTLDVPPPVDKTTPKADIRSMMKVSRISTYYECIDTKETTHDVSQGGTYVVLYNKGLVSPGDEWLPKGQEPKRNDNSVAKMLDAAIGLKLIDIDKDNLYAFNTTHKNLITKYSNWKSLYELLKERIEEKLADKDFIDNIENYYALYYLYEESQIPAKLMVFNKTPMQAVVDKIKSPSSNFLKYFNEIISSAEKFDNFLDELEITSPKNIDYSLRKKNWNDPSPLSISVLTTLLDNSSKYLKTKDLKKVMEKSKNKVNKLTTKMSQDYPILNHLIGQHYDLKNDSKSIALYINMCDKTKSLIKSSI